MGLDFLPEHGDASGARRSGFAVASGEIGNNIMKGDQAAGAYQRTVILEVSFHALVSVVAVDEHEVQRLAIEYRAHALKSLGSTGISRQATNSLFLSRKAGVNQASFLGQGEIDADQDCIGRAHLAEQV